MMQIVAANVPISQLMNVFNFLRTLIVMTIVAKNRFCF